MTKNEIRATLRQRQPAGSPVEASCVVSRLKENSRFQQAHTLFIYSALPDEIPTLPLMDELLNKGKTVVLPCVTGSNTMELRHYTGRHDLQTGAFSIMEPIGQPFTDYEQVDVAIVPGMAFDKKGHRLGRGKGYYDRFLPLLSNAYKIGICYPSRLLDYIPSDEHDIIMDEVIS